MSEVIVQVSDLIEFDTPSFQPSQFPYYGPFEAAGIKALAWWGLRAYSSASIGSNVIKVRRSSDGTTKTFPSMGTGTIDITDSFFDGSNYFADTLYDQTGNGNDLTQPTTAQQPQLLLTGLNGRPILNGGTAPTDNIGLGVTWAPGTVPEPWSISAVAMRSTVFDFATIVTVSNGSYGLWFQTAVANVLSAFGSLEIDAACTDNVWHGLHFVGSGTSSLVGVDSTITAGNDGGLAPIINGERVNVMWDGANHSLVGKWAEGGLWAGAFSSGQIIALQNSQHIWWRF